VLMLNVIRNRRWDREHSPTFDPSVTT
jgi:hypothetical protein